MWNLIKPRTATLRFWQLGLLVLVFVFWHVMTAPGLIPPIMFDNDRQAAFFFGEPLEIFLRIWMWFVVDANIYKHLGITLVETILAFGIGASTGLMGGLWLALSPMASAILEPYIKALNAMPRIILAPIFAVWFGLGIGSKVALGVTLVFFYCLFQCLPRCQRSQPCGACQCTHVGGQSKPVAAPRLFTQRHKLGLQLPPHFSRFSICRGRSW